MLQAVECPKCSKKAVVQRTGELYQCLACDFKRDFSKSDESRWDADPSFLVMVVLMALFITLVII